MPQTEGIETFRRFQAARVAAQIETDPAYVPSPGMFIPSSGTAIVPEQMELANAEVGYWESSAPKYYDVSNVTASMGFVIVHSGDGPSETSDSLDILVSIAGPAGDTIADAELGEAAELTNKLQAVVDYARSHRQQEVADCLVRLGQRPLGDDEEPLQPASAMSFVEYYIARRKQARPLMTVTPAGELDATWKGPKRERITMRFFPNRSVWVAYKLLRQTGSFEAAATDLLGPDLAFNIPDWA